MAFAWRRKRGGRLIWYAPEDVIVCSRCRVSIPDHHIPAEAHASWTHKVLRLCYDCAPAFLRWWRKQR